MPALGDAGWPAHWYNNDRHIPCLAQRCDKVFHTSEEFRQRRFHWNSDVPLSPSYHDHKILLAMNTQTRCVWCNYQNNSLKDLLYHERKEHRTSDMSSIEGYLSLMRSNRTHDDANACKVHAFERMVINIGTLQKHHDALIRKTARLSVQESLTSRSLPVQEEALELDFDRIKEIFYEENTKAGRDRTAVIPAEKFLTHLMPGSNDRQDWPHHYDKLRSLYRQGQI